MAKNKPISFKARLWLYPGGTAAWHFITVPKAHSTALKKEHGGNARGWGSLPVRIMIGKTSFETSIFPDKTSGCYILPVRAAVRKVEGLQADDMTKVTLTIR